MGNLTHTVSGDIASFRSAARVPIESLKCYFKPKQDLHGYSKPWPGGGGKNQLNIEAVEYGTFDQETGLPITSSYSSQVRTTYDITVIAGDSWILSNNVSHNCRCFFWDINGDYVGNVLAVVNTAFTIPTNAIKMRVVSGADRFLASENQQLEKGTTATSYEPYENICPIEGWTTTEIQHSKKNLLDTTKNNRVGIYSQWSATNGTISTTSVTAWNSTHVWFTQVFAPGTYTISCDYSGTGSNGPRLICSKSIDGGTWNNSYQGYWKNFTGRSCTFTTNEAFSVALIFISRTDHNGESCTFYNIQLEQGSIATEYESYCGEQVPITFPVLGKNKIDIGTVTFTTYKTYTLENELPPGTYTFSAIITTNDTDDTTNLVYIATRNNGIYIPLNRNDRSYYTFIANSNIYAIYIYSAKTYATSVGDTATYTNVQLELGNTMTEYEPYNPDNTVYGGYVDIAKGEVVATHRKMILDYSHAGSMNQYTNYNRIVRGIATTDDAPDTTTVQKCPFNYLKSSNSASDLWAGYIATTGNLICYVPKIIDSAETWANYIKDHPLEFVYKIATPIHYPLSKIELKTFLDQNNIWSNTNDITEISYQIHDSNMIQSSKKGIIAAEPHIETNSIVSFNTDMIAPIKKAIINFEPIQEGSGDPSPSNIRPIKGFDFIKTTYCPNNLFPRGSHTRIQNGITFTYYENGDVHIEGTATANAWINVPSSMYFTITPGTYRLGGNKIGSEVSVYLVVSTNNGGDLGWYVSNETGSTRTIDFTDSSTHVQITVRSGKTVNTTIHPYLILEEEYNKMKKTEIPLTQGKNLFNEEYPNLSANLQYLPYYVGDETIIVSTDCPQNTNNYSNLFCIPGIVTTGASTGWTDIHTSLYRTITPINGYITMVYRNVNGADPSQYHTMIERQAEGQTSPSTYEPFQYMYGGYIDLIKGELVQTYTYGAITNATFGGEWDGTKGAYWYTGTGELGLPAKKADGSYGLCNTLKPIYNVTFADTQNVIRIYDNGIIRWIDTAHMTDTTADYKTYLMNNPIYIAYEMATPITYQLTPQVLKTLRGQNNIWSNANGPIEIKYWTH